MPMTLAQTQTVPVQTVPVQPVPARPVQVVPVQPAPVAPAPVTTIPAGPPAAGALGNVSGAPYAPGTPEITRSGEAGLAQATRTEAGTEAHGGHDAVGFPPFKSETYASQLLWLALAFGALYLFVERVVTPRLGGLLDARAARIRADLDAAATARTRSEAAVSAYEAALAGARSKAGEIAAKTRAEASAKTDARRRTLEDELSGRLEGAEATIAARKASAMGSVREVAADTAGLLVERLTGRAAAPAEVEAALARTGA